MRPPVVVTAADGSPSPRPAPRGQASPLAPELADKTLDQLFTMLAKPDDAAMGAAVETEIQQRWMKSGSDTIDLLMSWAGEAAAAKDYGRSLDYLDAIIALKPDFAEGWNRRATIFYMEDDYGKAIADLEKVLALQPRHFGALAGLGLILHDIDRDKEALAVLRRAIEIDPYLDEDITKTIEELTPKVDGTPI